MNKKKWFCIIGLLVLMLISLPVQATEVSASPTINMEVKCGFQNNLKKKECVPVRVKLWGARDSFSGILRIEIPIQSQTNINASIWMSDVDGLNNKEECYIWEREVHLERGESTDEIFYLELPSYQANLKVSLLSGKAVLEEKWIRCDFSENSSLLAGIISSSQKENIQVNEIPAGLDISYGRDVFVKSFYLDEKDIYENVSALEHLDLLIAEKNIELNEAQKRAIEIWRARGGIYYEKGNEKFLDTLIYLSSIAYKEEFQVMLDEIGVLETNTNNFDRIPVKEKIPMGRYVLIIVLYLAAVGPGLYWFLRDKKNPRWLIGSVCMLSLISMFVIYLVGKNSRMGAPTICYEALYEQNDQYMSENVDFSLLVYQMKDFELEFDGKYDILPKNVGSVGSRSIDERTAEKVTFRTYDDKSSILLENMSSYSQNCFSMESSESLTSKQQIQFKISGGEESLQIAWENPTSYSIDNAVLVLKNRAVVLGKLAPLSRGTLDDARIYSYGDGGMANLLKDLLDFSVYDFPEYEIENFANKIWEETRGHGKYDAFVMGIMENAPTIFSYNEGFDVYGTSLMKIKVDIDWEDDGVLYCPNLEVYSEIYKGEYSAESNVLDGKEAIVDYKTDLSLLTLQFFEADYTNPQNSVPFSGKISLFNWRTGTFTELTNWRKPLNEFILEPFVSSIGVIRVYYTMDDWLMNSNRSCALPCIKVSGEVK